jgi:hypothetical protein
MEIGKIIMFISFVLYSYSVVKVVLRDNGVICKEYIFFKIYFIIFTILFILGVAFLI